MIALLLLPVLAYRLYPLSDETSIYLRFPIGERRGNVHYTYNVTIKGMNDLVVEAKSDKVKEEEPAPGVEGLVYDAHRSFNFDCHYEQIRTE